MAADYQLSFTDILMIIRRRALLLSGSFLVLFACVLVVAVVLPPVYQSSGIILVESQQIPVELVQSTVTSYADERIQIIKQRVMTRENLFRIIEQHRLFRKEADSLTVTEMVERMRSLIGIEPVITNGPQQRGRKPGTVAFRVSFQDRSPTVAHRVSNELVTLFLSENAKVRTERANETADFLAREAEKLRAELEAVENKVAAFKQEHGNALPEHLSLRMTILQRAEEELKNVTRELKSTQEERRFLDVEMAAAKTGRISENSVSSPVIELERLKAEYQALAVRYQESHPDLRALRAKIDAAEKTTSQGKTESAPILTSEALRVAEIQAKIDAGNIRLESLTAQQQSLQKRIREIEAQIIQTPQTERQLAALLRDHENVQNKFEEVRAKEVDARMAKSLEEESKAERFSLLEPPSVPEQPIKPDRKKITLLGFFGSLAGGGGLVFLLEMLNQRVWGAALMTHVIRQPPLVVIPYIATVAESRNRTRKIKRALLIGGVLILIGLASLHFLYMPLDMIFFKIMARW